MAMTKHLAVLLAVLGVGACVRPLRPPDAPIVDPARLPLEVLPGILAWCKLPPGADVPRRRDGSSPITAVVYAPEGTFVVISSSAATTTPDCIERELRAIRLTPTSDPIVGTIATITETIARAGVSVEVLTVAETDYFLVPTGRVVRVIEALRRTGHTVRESP